MKFYLLFVVLIFSSLKAQVPAPYDFSFFFEDEEKILRELPHISRSEIKLLDEIYAENFYKPIWDTKAKVLGLDNWTKTAKKNWERCF